MFQLKSKLVYVEKRLKEIILKVIVSVTPQKKKNCSSHVSTAQEKEKSLSISTEEK